MARDVLPFNVECKSTYPFFERIAAFNCEPAARKYAKLCAENGDYEYRVTKNGRVISTYLHEFEYEAVA